MQSPHLVQKTRVKNTWGARALLICLICIRGMWRCTGYGFWGPVVFRVCNCTRTSRIPVTRTSRQLEAIYIYLQIVFCIILPSITRTPNNSNFFLFPLKVRIIGCIICILFRVVGVWLINWPCTVFKWSQVWYPFFFIYSIMSAKKAHFGVRTEPNKGHEKRSFVLKRVANPGRAG